MNKVIIAGPRDFNDKDYIYKELDNIFYLIQQNLNKEKIEIVQGGANGVDALAKQYARNYDMPCKEFKADWKQHGKAAGPIRNKEMAEYSNMLIAFQPGLPTKGTQNMIKTAKKYGLTCFTVIKEGNITKIICEK